jgi:hypothetical protein
VTEALENGIERKVWRILKEKQDYKCGHISLRGI